MNNCIYVGPFKSHIENYINLKRAIGYKYDTEARHLKRFGRFTLEKYPKANTLTKSMILDWCKKKLTKLNGINYAAFLYCVNLQNTSTQLELNRIYYRRDIIQKQNDISLIFIRWMN